MADIGIVPGEVVESGAGNIVDNAHNCGEAGGLEGGDLVFLDGASNKYKKESADVDTSNAQIGVCLNAAGLNQPVSVLQLGDVDLGATAAIVEGKIICASPNAGKMCYSDDPLLAAGDYRKNIGVCGADGILKTKPFSTDAQIQ